MRRTKNNRQTDDQQGHHRQAGPQGRSLRGPRDDERQENRRDQNDERRRIQGQVDGIAQCIDIDRGANCNNDQETKSEQCGLNENARFIRPTMQKSHIVSRIEIFVGGVPLDPRAFARSDRAEASVFRSVVMPMARMVAMRMVVMMRRRKRGRRGRRGRENVEGVEIEAEHRQREVLRDDGECGEGESTASKDRDRQRTNHIEAPGHTAS